MRMQLYVYMHVCTVCMYLYTPCFYLKFFPIYVILRTSMEWGMSEFEDTEITRPEYEGTISGKSPIDGTVAVHYKHE